VSAALGCRVTGTGDTTVVLLHGFGGSGAVWHELAARLGNHATVLAHDVPGHGESLEHPAAGSPGKCADAIRADLGERGYQRFHLVGHSMGGAIATLMTLAAPDQVASLTLLAPGGFGPEINGRLLRHWARADTTETVTLCLEQMQGWETPVPADVVERVVADRRLPGQRDRLIAIADKITRGERQGVIPREQLETLRMPVKVLWGTQDRVLPTRQVHGLPVRLASHVFERTGHMLIEEQADVVFDLIKQNIAAGSHG
jgi:pyruvate dehydrogenase E2 component (dihydrolipoamide acetyltransferase)